VAVWHCLYLGVNVRIQLKQDRTHRWLLWWTTDGNRSFPINYKNVQSIPEQSPDPLEAYRPYREAMNRVLAGQPEIFDGQYDRAARKLKVKALSVEVIPRLG